MTDREFERVALDLFRTQAEKKFREGNTEHSPDGRRPIVGIPPFTLIRHMKEEVIDQWMYICALEQRLLLNENAQHCRYERDENGNLHIATRDENCS